MVRWHERRGYTLRMPEAGGMGPTRAPGNGRYLRLSLVERSGFLHGLYNVRETRAEADGEVPVVSEGRSLSWRWLRRKDAERLLEARLRTFEALGYGVVDTSVQSRGRWGWLQELLRRRLAPDENAGPASTDVIQEALRLVGPDAPAVLEGLGALLGCSDGQLRNPEASWLRTTEGDKLAVVLPFLLGHDDPDVRRIGEACLQVPTTAYQVPQPSLVGWLEIDRRISRILAPRLAREGLALVGPDALQRLAHSAADPDVRAEAQTWVERFASSEV